MQKLNGAGDRLWTKQAGGPGSDICWGIAADKDGNTFISGSFFGSTIGFDGVSLTSASPGQETIFMTKYDAAGSAVWGRSIGGSKNDGGRGVAVDLDGNAYLTGFFGGSADFGGTNLTSAGALDVFFAKFDPDGKLLWVRQARTARQATGQYVAVDGRGNCYFAGSFWDSIAIGNTTLYNAAPPSARVAAFLAKLDSSGNVLWATKAVGNDVGPGGVGADANGNVYLTGGFTSFAVFDTTTLTTISNLDKFDMFLAKYNGSGVVQWATNAGGLEDDYANGIAVDLSGNCYIAGQFGGSAMFGYTNLSSSGGLDAILAKYNGSGVLQWAQKGGGPGIDYARGVAVDRLGNSFIVGAFSSTATFGGVSAASAGDLDVFVAKRPTRPPVIITAPASQTAIAGSDAIFTVSATSDALINYQWNKAGVALTGQTAAD